MASIDFPLSPPEALATFWHVVESVALAVGRLDDRARTQLLEKAAALGVHPVDAQKVLDTAASADASPPSGWAVRIEHTYDYNGQPVFGLDVQGPAFPRVVGCSLRTLAGRVVDLPLRRLLSAGRGLWPIRMSDRELWTSFETGEDALGVRQLAGDVIFAVWADQTLHERLADSGWARWNTARVPPDASLHFLEYVDGMIEEDYGARSDVWDLQMEPLTFREAWERLDQRASALGWTWSATTQGVGPTAAGTLGFIRSADDGKTLLCCHATGPRRGSTFFVRGGIGFCYRRHFGGPRGFLGLPVSDEHAVPEGARSDFEGGRLVWQRQGSVVRAFRGATATAPEREVRV